MHILKLATEQELQALLRARGDQHLMSLFSKMAEELKSELVRADDPIQVHRLQGKAQLSLEVLAAVDEAADVLERKRSHP